MADRPPREPSSPPQRYANYWESRTISSPRSKAELRNEEVQPSHASVLQNRAIGEVLKAVGVPASASPSGAAFKLFALELTMNSQGSIRTKDHKAKEWILRNSRFRENPVFRFSQQRQTLVRSTRRDLIEMVRCRAPSFAQDLSSAIESRQATAGAPLLGEMVPWLLSDLFDLTPEDASLISKGWLALYMSAAVLDDILDKEIQATAKTVLLASLLQSVANELFFPFLKDFTAHTEFHESIQRAIEYELRDAAHLKSPSLTAWKKAARLKNSGLQALAIAAAQARQRNGHDSTRIRQFVDILLLPFQLLDDLFDLPSDMERKNRTYLGELFSNGQNYTQSCDVYFAALKSGALTRVIASIKFSISRSTKLFDKDEDFEKDGYIFLITLRQELTELRNWIQTQATDDAKPDTFAAELMQRLTIVAQYS